MYESSRSSRSQMFFKIVVQRPATLLKRDSITGVSCEYSKIFKNSFLYRTPPMAASKVGTAMTHKNVIKVTFVDFFS